MVRVSGLPSDLGSGLSVLLLTGSDAGRLVCYPRVLGAAAPVCGDRDDAFASARPVLLTEPSSPASVRVPFRTPGDASDGKD